MNHAQDQSVNFEFVFKGSIRIAAKKKQILELLQNEAAGAAGFSVPTEELLVLVVACPVGKLVMGPHPLPALNCIPKSYADSWIRAMEDFDRF